MKTITLAFITAILMTTSGCSFNAHDNTTSRNSESNLIYDFVEQKVQPLMLDNDDKETNFLHPGEQRTVQNYFEPIDALVLTSHISYLGDISNKVRLYPFGEIVGLEGEGKTSFVVFVEERYKVEQQINMLRITSIEDTSSDNILVFMEITQIPNITVEEIEENILSDIDFSNYPINNHRQPTYDFPFAWIRLIDGGGADSIVTTTYIRDNYHGGVFVITTQYSFGRSWMYTSDFMNVLKTLEIITESEHLTLSNDIADSDVYLDSAATIQDLFEPKFIMTFMMGSPVMARYYPFGTIVEAGIEGIASYVIFIERFYQVTQENNLLKITPFWEMPIDWPEFFMEIKQVSNTTISEMEQKIVNSTDFDSYCEVFHSQLTEYFPFVRFTMFSAFDAGDIVTDIYIKDNKNGGVFVITTQYTEEAAEGIGARFRNFLKTLEILDLGK